MIAGAAGAKILKRKSPKHGFPLQKQCFGSVSETFSTAKPCKILKNKQIGVRTLKRPPPFSWEPKNKGGSFKVITPISKKNRAFGAIFIPIFSVFRDRYHVLNIKNNVFTCFLSYTTFLQCVYASWHFDSTGWPNWDYGSSIIISVVLLCQKRDQQILNT